MRARTAAGTLLLIATLAPAVIANSGDRTGPSRRWAAVYMKEPTLIGSVIVEGPVIFVHDDEQMARGEPCTSVRLFHPQQGPADEIASFHCIPTQRRAVETFTMTTRPNRELGYGCILIDYQFAGDTEAHGVPLSVNAQLTTGGPFTRGDR